jgi:uncharacterized membrane protein
VVVFQASSREVIIDIFFYYYWSILKLILIKFEWCKSNKSKKQKQKKKQIPNNKPNNK